MNALRSHLRKNLKSTALILAPAVIAALADALMTLHGQGASFWAGNFSAAAEAEPMARPFLALGPVVWMLFILAYLAVYLTPPLLVGCYSRAIAEICSIHLTICHVLGVFSWLGIFLPGGFPAVDLYAGIPALAWFVYRWIAAFRSSANSQEVKSDRPNDNFDLLQEAWLALPAVARSGLLGLRAD